MHVSAYIAAVRGKVRDDNDENDDDEESVVTDDDSDQEVTPVDDQSLPRKTARDVTELTTYRRDRNAFSDNTRSPPANMVTGSYKFQIAQGTAKVSVSAATSSTVNSTRQSTAQCAVDM